MLVEGTVDLSPSSSAALLRNPGQLGFLPDLSISSIGDVGSVLLFSKLPLARLGGANVGLSPASATSVLLLRILLESHAGVKPHYGKPSDDSDAVLWIGDRALRERREGRWPHVYDLGSLWLDATDTPFVFALWIARRESFERDPEGFRLFYRRLVAARQCAYRSYPRYAQTAPEAAWMGERDLLDYWGGISYDLTAWHMAGLRRYAEEAVKLGEIPAVPDLRPLHVEPGS
jgi:chorismate dehydratase